MSDSDSDPFVRHATHNLDSQPELACSPLDRAGGPPGVRHKNTRLGRRSGSHPDEQETLLAQLEGHGINPAPGLPVLLHRRQELDTYMALIGELQLKYARNIFYQYHKAFSSKAALYISQYNSRLDWSVLDTELLVMVAGGTQTVSCGSCWNSGHIAPLCPSAVFQPTFAGRKLLQGCSPPAFRNICPEASPVSTTVPSCHTLILL
ncbi:hypothetical protein VZT92_022654 [Zoarces viviparus]|uniref:Uncharacterized protein n=1 Tax=Zoarces viviparus TaxID=48416 RepID=A0AAW1EBC0_ZOAVI